MLIGEFCFATVLFRLVLAAVLSGVLGLERENKQRPAGFRTYLLVCLGAAATMLLGEYEAAYFVDDVTKLDISRVGAQVINGIGFLGAGTIIVTSQQEVKGLTTAAGLWASACMGLAVGAGNYACALLGFGMIMVSFRLFPGIEDYFSRQSRHMTLYLEFHKLPDMHRIVEMLKSRGIDIYEVEMLDKKESLTNRPAAIFTLYLNQKQRHEDVLVFLSESDFILHIDEV